MPAFNLLPVPVQTALTKSSGNTAADYDPKNVIIQNAVGHNGVWVAPFLNYDFSESNFLTLIINLTQVATLNAGPAAARAYVKTDPTKDAWIIFDMSDERTGAPIAKVFSCV